MKKFILSILLGFCILGTQLNFANTAAEAEKAYQAKNYEKSVQIYESLLKQNESNSDLLYNLGNAYLKNNQLGLAIAMYRKAQVLSPRDKDLKKNLSIARKLVLDETKPQQAPVMTWFIDFLKLFSLNEFYLGLLFIFLALNILLILKFLDRKPGLIKQLLVVWSVVFISYLFLFSIKSSLNSVDGSGVLVVKKVDVKSGPSETLPTLYYIHEGVEFEILKSVNGWSEIQLPNGYNGWVKQGVYLVI